MTYKSRNVVFKSGRTSKAKSTPLIFQMPRPPFHNSGTTTGAVTVLSWLRFKTTNELFPSKIPERVQVPGIADSCCIFKPTLACADDLSRFEAKFNLLSIAWMLVVAGNGPENPSARVWSVKSIAHTTHAIAGQQWQRDQRTAAGRRCSCRLREEIEFIKPTAF